LPPWPIWAVAATTLWLGFAWFAHQRWPGVTLCTFRRATGVPCPGCGLTRGVTALASGDVATGLAYNPVLLAGILVFVAVLGFRLLSGLAPRFDLRPRQRRAAWILGAALVLANWAYVIATLPPDPL
jgi:hypothetical protein